MWYKFNPYEWAVRVPLIVSTPSARQGREECGNVSLVDLLPTLLDLATDGRPPELAAEIDGHSLAKLLHGPDPEWRDEVKVEFTAEGIHAPCLILRKGRYKYVYCETDPGMLFDLESDPRELRNLCNDPRSSGIQREMESAILTHWNPAELKARILASQRQRLFLHKALSRGRHVPWDYQPLRDASKLYVRSASTTDTTSTKAKARLPYVPPTLPDYPRRSS
jgi:choline-sulfatase